MENNISGLNRRHFIQGSAFALALPWLETFAAPTGTKIPKRFASIYWPDGVGVPSKEDPAFHDWCWFPRGKGKDYQFTKVLDVLEPLRKDLTIFSGMSHPGGRDIHGHANADQYLTGAVTTLKGQPKGPYKNSISVDQVIAAETGKMTRYNSLVMSTNGGTGGPRAATTQSFNRDGKPIPSLNNPKQIFDSLFLAKGPEAIKQLAMSKSALDDLMLDARSLNHKLSSHDQKTLSDYMDSVRDTEIKVEKAKQWLNTAMPKVKSDHINLNASVEEDPRVYIQTMYELIFLAFQTDVTRVATYSVGRENAGGIHDLLIRAVLSDGNTHSLTHGTKEPGGWKRLGIYDRFLAEEYGRFIQKLKDTPEVGGTGSMLDNTAVLFGSASSSFHLSRNYPLILSGGKAMGFKHGQFLKRGKGNEDFLSTAGPTGKEWSNRVTYEEEPFANLLLTVLHKLGIPAKKFADSTGTVAEI